MRKTLKNKSLVIFIMGCMTALSPFSIDMYLPAFQSIAADFNTTVARVSLSLSSYFIGLAGGQLFYGPLLDRFGRKKPMYAGLAIYIVACFFCMLSRSTESLVAWRFLQAIGGCAVGVGSMAMVRDLFSLKEGAKVFSLLMLILGASPLFAPTIGGYIAAAWGWSVVFIVLAGMAVVLMLVIRFVLEESHQPDPNVSLRVVPIVRDFLEILKNPYFYTYVFSCATAFSGLFVYLAGSPVIFLETYKVGTKTYGWIFAIIATGMIGASQFNVMLLRRFTNEQILQVALSAQVAIATILSIATYFECGLSTTVFLLFLFMASFGLTNPNGAPLALQPFSKNAGRASALLGFLQMSIGAAASTIVGILGVSQMLPVVLIMAITSGVGLSVLILGARNLPPLVTDDDVFHS